MDRLKPTHKIRGERGVAMIEFAMTLPVLMLVVLGMCDFARLLQRYQVLTNAAREGARMAVLPGYGLQDVQNRVTSYLDAAGVNTTAQTSSTMSAVTPTSGPVFNAMTVTVRSDYTFSLLGPIASTFGGSFGTVTLTATAVMRAETAGG
jgi:Flp pilus assembly protein TadG